MIRIALIPFLLFWCNAYSQIANSIQNYESSYQKKCNRAALKYTDIHDIVCYDSKKEIANLEIVFLPIYQVKNSHKTEDISSFLRGLKISKKSKPMFFATLKNQYFGRLVSTQTNNPWMTRFEIYCDDKLDRTTHAESINEVNFILKYRPDAVINIIGYRFPLILIKGQEYFFIKYFNGTELKLIRPDDWVNDFKLKTDKHWSVLNY